MGMWCTRDIYCEAKNHVERCPVSTRYIKEPREDFGDLLWVGIITVTIIVLIGFGLSKLPDNPRPERVTQQQRFDNMDKSHIEFCENNMHLITKHREYYTCQQLLGQL